MMMTFTDSTERYDTRQYNNKRFCHTTHSRHLTLPLLPPPEIPLPAERNLVINEKLNQSSIPNANHHETERGLVERGRVLVVVLVPPAVFHCSAFSFSPTS